MRKATVLLLLAMLPALLFSGTTGKIAGTVKDAQTGEALVGANVLIEGTYLGTATDGDGYFVILNVPVGRHDLKALYMGYQDVVQEEVRVSVDLSTEINFELQPTTLQGETVVVTAERRMIRKDETNTNIIRSAEEIDQLPIRGLQDLSATIAGVVKQDNSNVMNIRGGRGNESAVYVDGVLVNDPYNSAIRAYVPNEAIEELSVQTGGFNAEYGEAMSGIIIMTTNSGTQRYSGSAQVITDGFLPYDKKVLGTYGYGFNEYNLTFGGPIIPGTRHTFFGSATRQWQKDGAPSWGWAMNENKPEEFKGGPVPGQEDQRWSYTGKVRFQLSKSMELKGSYVHTDRTYSYTGIFNGMNPIYLYDVGHAPQTQTLHQSANGTFTHTLSPRTYYDLKFNYYNTKRTYYDRFFGDDIFSYGDPTFVPDTAFANNPDNFGQAFTYRYDYPDYFQPGAQFDDYFKNQTSYMGVDFDLTHQQGQHHTIKLGFDYKYHTLREYRVLNPTLLAKTTDITELERFRNADVRFYGYDIRGNKVDDGDYLTDVNRAENGTPLDGYQNQAPYNPIYMSAYIQDKIEFDDLILNLGLRYDRIDPNAWQFRQIEVERDADGNIIEGSGMFGGDNIFNGDDTEASDSYSYLSPRFGLSFPVSDNTVFHAQYGKFYQKPNLQDLYLSPFYLDAFIEGGYFTIIDNPNLRPEKTTSFEVGFKQRLGSNASLQLTTFYKETEDLVMVLPMPTDVREIAFMQNGDFGVVKGFDIIFNLRRSQNLSANFSYELQVAEGTGSASASNFDIAWIDGRDGAYPKFIQPLTFEQRHRGSVNVDYRLGSGEGPELMGLQPLERTGLNLLFSFNSGHPFTRTSVLNTQPHDGRWDNDISQTPVSAVNSQLTPWTYRFDLKVDKTIPLGGGLDINLYAWVLNLLNTETVNFVWATTGQAGQTGYLQTEPGKAWYNTLSATQKQAFSMREMDFTNYGMPRQIRLGAKISF